MTFFPMLPSVNENAKPESNPMPWLLYLYSVFLISFTDPNNQLFNAKSMFEFLNHDFSVLQIYIFITFIGM